jgi:hypothetical protein
MASEILNQMKKYNEAIESYKRSETYFEREDIPAETKIGRADDCFKLVNHITGIMKKVEELGYKMTDEEILEGFRQVKFLEL